MTTNPTATATPPTSTELGLGPRLPSKPKRVRPSRAKPRPPITTVTPTPSTPRPPPKRKRSENYHKVKNDKYNRSAFRRQTLMKLITQLAQPWRDNPLLLIERLCIADALFIGVAGTALRLGAETKEGMTERLMTMQKKLMTINMGAVL